MLHICQVNLSHLIPHRRSSPMWWSTLCVTASMDTMRSTSPCSRRCGMLGDTMHYQMCTIPVIFNKSASLVLQPLMYKKIKGHINPHEMYIRKLLGEGSVTQVRVR